MPAGAPEIGSLAAIGLMDMRRFHARAHIEDPQHEPYALIKLSNRRFAGLITGRVKDQSLGHLQGRGPVLAPLALKRKRQALRKKEAAEQ